MIPYYYGRDIEYARKRLENTLVYSSKKKDLIYIHGVHEDPSPRVFFSGVLVSETTKGADFNVEDIDLEPISLGYVYLSKKERACFLSRVPMRTAYRQGLATACLHLSGSSSKSDLELKDLMMAAFNSYPTLASAKKAVTKCLSMPFSRHFALTSEGRILYRGQSVVGKLNAAGHPILEPEYGYLQQHLDSLIK